MLKRSDWLLRTTTEVHTIPDVGGCKHILILIPTKLHQELMETIAAYCTSMQDVAVYATKHCDANTVLRVQHSWFIGPMASTHHASPTAETSNWCLQVMPPKIHLTKPTCEPVDLRHSFYRSTSSCHLLQSLHYSTDAFGLCRINPSTYRHHYKVVSSILHKFGLVHVFGDLELYIDTDPPGS